MPKSKKKKNDNSKTTKQDPSDDKTNGPRGSDPADSENKENNGSEDLNPENKENESSEDLVDPENEEDTGSEDLTESDDGFCACITAFFPWLWNTVCCCGCCSCFLGTSEESNEQPTRGNSG